MMTDFPIRTKAESINTIGIARIIPFGEIWAPKERKNRTRKKSLKGPKRELISYREGRIDSEAPAIKAPLSKENPIILNNDAIPIPQAIEKRSSISSEPERKLFIFGNTYFEHNIKKVITNKPKENLFKRTAIEKCPVEKSGKVKSKI